MRRKDKEIADRFAIESIIKKANVCRLAMVDNGKPYMVPLSFGYEDGMLYLHSSAKGQKIDILKKNPHVCFEFDIMVEPIESKTACDWSMKYKSVIGFGKAVFIEDLEEKGRALNIIMSQYSKSKFEFPEGMIKTTTVIKIKVENITGKQSGF